MNQIDRKKEADILEAWRIIVKRKWVIVTFSGALIFFIGVFSFLATPQYRAATTLLIEEESSRILSIDETFSNQPQIFRDLRFYNTQLKLLKSKSLAERVVNRLNLLSRSEFKTNNKKNKGVLSSAKELISLKWILPKKKSNERISKYSISSDSYSEVVSQVQREIQVKPVRETRLVEASFTSPSPILATEIVNTLAEEFINFSIEKRYETTQEASDFLSEQIANLREDLAAKERELQRYGREKEIFFLNDTESTVVRKFADLNENYTQAQVDRINAEAAYRELRDLKVDSLPQFVNNPMIQELKAEYTRMRNQYEEESKVFKPGYPEMIKLRAKIDSMRDELQSEIRKAVDAAYSEYQSALKRETSLKNLLDEQKEDVVRLNSNAILYNSLEIEVENKRNLLNSLVERQNETLVSARLGGLKTGNISIIDKAEIPKDPVFPKKKLNLILALLMGLFGGAGLCFIFEYLDNTVKGPEDVEKLTGLPSLGVIPYLPSEGVKKKKRYNYYSRFKYAYKDENLRSEDNLSEITEIEFVNLHHPKFFISEDYRTARTSILLSHADSPPKTIVFTSASPKEGKTATVTNMAVSFSQLEKKVLVVDSDLRKPRLHRIFKVRNAKGLSWYLIGKIPLEEAIQKTTIQNIWILPSGLIPPNPAELLNSQKMKEMMEEIKKVFDVILFDTPPLLAVVDGVIASSFADSTILVVKAGKATQKPFMNAVEELWRAKAKIIGVLFNGVKVKKGDYHFMDYYRYYRYHYYEEEKGVNGKQ